MEFSPFKLLVLAVFATALVYVLFNNILPQFNPPEIVSTIRETIPVAETANGISIQRANIAANVGTSIRASSFEKPNRIVTFECLSPTQCCSPAESSCAKPFKVALKDLIVVKSTKTTVSARCFLQETIFVCKVFLGGTPAQVELSNIRAPSQVQLDSNNVLAFTVEATNSGGTDLVDKLDIHPQVFKTISNAGIGREELLTKLEPQNVSPLRPGQKKTISFQYKVLSAGDYRIALSAESELAGKSFAEFRFVASGVPPTECTASQLEGNPFYYNNLDPNFQDIYGKCVQKALCQKCEFISTTCSNAWKAKVLNGTFRDASVDYAYQLLDDSFCQ